MIRGRFLFLRAGGDRRSKGRVKGETIIVRNRDYYTVRPTGCFSLALEENK